MSSSKRIVITVLTLGLSILGLTAPKAQAANGESIAMSPTSVRISADPGSSLKRTISVINDGSRDINFTMYARPYSVDGENYKPIFSKLSPTTDAYEWVQFQQTNYSLKPGETAEVPFTISVPAKADSGGHYGVIFAETQPGKADQGSVVRKKRVGSILYATVNGDNKSEGSVLGNTIGFLQTHQPLSANSRVSNSGNVDFVDTTSIEVRDVFGNKKFSYTRDLTVLPSTTRSIQYQWKNSGFFGLYKVSVSHKFLGKTSSDTRFVMLLPVWLIVVLIALVIVAILLAVRRSNSSKKIKKSGSKPRKK